jgi:hypothetical protein
MKATTQTLPPSSRWTRENGLIEFGGTSVLRRTQGHLSNRKAGAMSCLFKTDGKVLWNPSNTVARLFKGQAEAAAVAFDVPSGIGAIIEDECEIELQAFERFLTELVKQYADATHPILRSLTSGLIAISSVLVERTDGQGTKNGANDTAPWAELAREYSRSMPR